MSSESPTLLEQVTAWSTLATAVGTVALAVMAVLAWRAAKGTLEASRDASRAAQEANEQMREDSIERTRPFVYVELVPGLAGQGSYDLRITNVGRSSAQVLTLNLDNWPDPLDDIAAATKKMFDTRRTLPPGCSLRTMWRIEGAMTDGTTEAGLPDEGSITVRYQGPDARSYEDKFEFSIASAGLWPLPDEGPTVNGDPDVRDFHHLGKTLARHLGELHR